MPTTTPLTDAINALTTYANETTGASDTDLSSAVATLVAGYGGGGSIGGLANMKDVSANAFEFAYMLKCMKDGNTKGGTVTWTSAFANTEQLILSTGLTTLHGIMFAITNNNLLSTNVYQQANKFLFIAVNQNDTTLANIMGQAANNVVRSFGYTIGNAQNSAPLNGTLRISGGDIYYTGRYNKNSDYQMLRPNVEYDWIAW